MAIIVNKMFELKVAGNRGFNRKNGDFVTKAFPLCIAYTRCVCEMIRLSEYADKPVEITCFLTRMAIPMNLEEYANWPAVVARMKREGTYPK